MAVIGEIRREIETRLAEAAGGGFIQLSREDGDVVLMQADLTCETEHVEGTDSDGNWVEVPYAAIKTVSLAVNLTRCSMTYCIEMLSTVISGASVSGMKLTGAVCACPPQPSSMIAYHQ